MITREQWKSRKVKRVLFPGPLSRVYIHHTGGYFPKTVEEEYQQMLTLQHIAIDIDKISDLPYNLVIGPSGNIYEGRGVGYKSAATLDQNDVSRSICCMGNFQTKQPTELMLQSCSYAIKLFQNEDCLANPVEILGHRENPKHPGATACPGNNLFNQMDKIKNPSKGEEVNPRFVRQSGFTNIFYVENANVLTLSGQLMASYEEEDPTIKKVWQDHMVSFMAMSEKAGLSSNNWERNPNETGKF